MSAAGARAQAQALLDGGAEPHAQAFDGAADALALAWALKDACYEAWTRQPPRARRCAAWLAVLAAAAPQPAVAALAHWTRGIAELAEGDAAGALRSLAAASATFDAAGDGRRAAEAQVPQVVALALAGRHDEALALGAQVHARLAALGDGPAAARVELNLASMLLRQGRYAEAGARYRGAAIAFARAGDVQHSVMADIGLAAALAWQFDFEESGLMYERAAQRARAHGLEALVGVIENNRGEFELNRGHHAPALRHLSAALAVVERQGSLPQQAEARRNLADAYAALGLWPEAEALYQRAVDAACQAGAPVEEAWAVVQRAQARAAQGADAAAGRDLDRARALFEAQGGAVGLARVALHAAALALRAGDAPRALDEATRAGAAFAAAGVRGWQAEAEVIAAEALAAAGRGADALARWQATLAAADTLPEIRAACLAGIGHLQRAAGARDAARRSYEQALAATEDQRAALPGDEFRTAYGAGRRSAPEALLALALDDGDGAQLLAASEAARAQALRMGLARAGAEADEALPERDRWHWLHAQWRHALAAGDTARADALRAPLQQAEQAWLEAARRVRAGAEAFAAPAADAPGADALADALDADQALVTYVQAGDRLAACVVTRAGVRRVELDGQGLDERIQRLRLQLDTLRHGAATLRRHAEQLAARARHHLAALHAQLWAPLLPALHGIGRVVVVPHRALHYVPFAALFDGRCHLAEQLATSVAPSAALWRAGRRPPRAPARLLALGHGGATLPHVAAEVRAVGAAFDGGATLLVDEQATLPALRERLAVADVLHLACHAEFRADNPAFSALHLADGPLTLRDAAALPLAGRLVTLSACETGLSTVAPGDEQLGLVRGFLLAGAPTVVASLWTVDDAATAALMAGFYRRVRGGQAPAEALRGAQCAAMAEHANPYFWAAFVVHGQG